jgi:hypothetical protein
MPPILESEARPTTKATTAATATAAGDDLFRRVSFV